MLSATPVVLTPTSGIEKLDAQCKANEYIKAIFDDSYEAVSGVRQFNESLQRNVWHFLICSSSAPLDKICVDINSGEIIPLTETSIRQIRERSLVMEATQRGELPKNINGYILAEYAVRRANRYLAMYVNMFLAGTDPVFLALERPVWQVTIYFKMYDVGPFHVGVLDIDAQTAEVIPLTEIQIKNLQKRTDAFVKSHSPSTEN